MTSEEVVKIEAFEHHMRQTICETRCRYRTGRRGTAVKVYTISDESKYLLIQRVPDIKSDLKQELLKLCQRFGPIERLVLTDYPNCEEFTKCYLIQYKVFANAVKAKKCLDEHNFFGSVLHVCYAPELETIDDTRDKLNQRRRYVSHMLAQSRDSELETNSNQAIAKNKEIPKFFDKSLIESDVETKSSDLKRKFSDISHKSGETQLESTEESTETKRTKPTPKIRWRLQNIEST